MTPGTKFDAIVVGAGPAGSTAATLLARAGWAVALVEKQSFPRRKVCGECLAASNLPLLDALGLARAFDARAGAELRRVTLMHGDAEVSAELPAAAHALYPWGRAIARETLDTLLLEQARAAGADVLQPWSVQAIRGVPGAWHCELRAVETAATMRLRGQVVIDAHGSWQELPTGRPQRRLARAAADLFAFKANYTGAALREGVISVLALEGGYGGMVVADGGVATLACCIRRDRLNELRLARPGLRAGAAVEAWLRRECSGVRVALHGALREGPWLASGPIDPGLRIAADDEVFRIGNAAGEAHPILGEGLSMAVQSAVLLCSHLLGEPRLTGAPAAVSHAGLQRRYAADFKRHFAPRLRLAATFAHAAMRPRPSAVLMALVRRWPGLLTQGARWGGKVSALQPGTAAAPGAPAAARAIEPGPDGPLASRAP